MWCKVKVWVEYRFRYQNRVLLSSWKFFFMYLYVFCLFVEIRSCCVHEAAFKSRESPCLSLPSAQITIVHYCEGPRFTYSLSLRSHSLSFFLRVVVVFHDRSHLPHWIPFLLLSLHTLSARHVLSKSGWGWFLTGQSRT